MSVDLDRYQAFVRGLASVPSTKIEALTERLAAIGERAPLLLTSSMGLSSESGEYAEIVKKMIFQGKELTEDVRQHLILELGDVAWYMAAACEALDTNLEHVISRNVAKLEARYPGGKFSVERSECRKAGDL